MKKNNTIKINTLICLVLQQKLHFTAVKNKLSLTLTLTLKSPGGQKYLRVKDFVVICINI